MEYRVGSLADLISGSPKKKSQSGDSGVKIVFQSVEGVNFTSKKKKNRNIDSYAENKGPGKKRKRDVDIQSDEYIRSKSKKKDTDIDSYVQNEGLKKKKKRDADIEALNVEHRKKKRRKASISNDEVISNENSSKPLDDSLDSENLVTTKSKAGEHGIRVSVNAKNAEMRLRKKEKKNKINHPVDEEKESRTIFVKNLPSNVKKFKLKKTFAKYGSVQSVRLRCAALSDPRIPKKVAVIKQKFHPERSNISAFVCFETAESANQALAANGTIIGDHHILVDKSVQEEHHDQRKAIFVGNLPFAAEEDDLWKLFESCGKILDIRIIRDRNTGIGKGFGYVNFESSDSVELALNLNGEKLKDRELRVSRASKKPKPGGVKQPLGFKTKSQRVGWKNKNHPSSQYANKARTDDGSNMASKEHLSPNLTGKSGKSNKIKFHENESGEVVNKKAGHPFFQGQTMFDKRKKKNKKRLNKDELKKRIVMKKLGMNSNMLLNNKVKLKL